MRIKGGLNRIGCNDLIGFDAEWTKNYKIKNGNVPFCFSIVTTSISNLSYSNLENGDVQFNYIQYYCENKEEFKELVSLAENWSSKILDVLESCVLCGHQLSSDFSVLYNIGKAYEIEPLINLERLRHEWRVRRESPSIHIMDTRYDIIQSFLGNSRRLVDMCNDFDLDVTQPELGNSSMTKLQNIFYQTKDEDIYERVSVMNLRHSFCAIVLYWLNEEICNAGQIRHINVNKSIYNGLNTDFNWVNSDKFSTLLERRVND